MRELSAVAPAVEITGDDDPNTLTGGAGDDILDGRGGSDTLYGEGGDDDLWTGYIDYDVETGAGSDRLYGGDGDDFLHQVMNGDLADGGAGIDTAEVELTFTHEPWVAGTLIWTSNYLGLTVDLTQATTGTLYLDVGGLDEGVTLTGIERFNITFGSGNDTAYGGAYADVLTGESYNFPSGDDVLYGRGGADVLNGMGGSDRLYGDQGDDVLDGGVVPPGFDDFAADEIYGGSGDDRLTGRIQDLIDGGAGHDVGLLFLGQSSFSYDIDLDVLTTLGRTHDLGDGTRVRNVERLEEVELGSGNDLVAGSSVADIVGGGQGDDQILGNEGNDRLWGGDGEDILLGNDGDDDLDGSDGDDHLFGGEGDDFLTGGFGDDRLEGGAGDDWLRGWFGNSEEIFGGDGNDRLEGTGTDFGLSGDDLIEGGAGDDEIYAYDGADIVRGGGGDDFIRDEGVPISIDGGDGRDTLEIAFWAEETGVYIDLRPMWAGGVGVIGSGTVQGIEGVRISGSNGNDVILLGVGSAGHQNDGVYVDAGPGDDVVMGGDAGFYYGDVIYGGDGADVLMGLGNHDYLSGGSGDDRLDGGSGDDDLLGGEGYDTALYDTATAGVTVSLAAGDRQQTGGSDADYLSSIEAIVGSAFADTLTGNAQANRLEGGAGDDILNGAAGDDLLIGGAGGDRLLGGAGIDTASYEAATAGVGVDLSITTVQNTGGSGRDRLVNVENLIGSAYGDVLRGSGVANALTDALGGNDRLEGMGGDDVLSVSRSGAGAATTVRLDGGDGGDTLSFSGAGRYVDTVSMLGGIGDDGIVVAGGGAVTIDAGAGSDTVTIDTLGGTYTVFLGAGADTLRLAATGGAFQTSSVNVVRDFQAGVGGDVLDLSAWLAGGALTGFTGGQNPFATGHLRLLQNGQRTLLQVDRDGGGDAFTTLLTFNGVQVSQWTAANLGGFSPYSAAAPTSEDKSDGQGGHAALAGVDPFWTEAEVVSLHRSVDGDWLL